MGEIPGLPTLEASLWSGRVDTVARSGREPTLGVIIIAMAEPFGNPSSKTGPAARTEANGDRAGTRDGRVLQEHFTGLGLLAVDRVVCILVEQGGDDVLTEDIRLAGARASPGHWNWNWLD